MSRPGPSPLTPVLFALLLLALAPVAGALAQGDAASVPVERTEEEIQQVTRRLNKSFMSPYCPGATLLDCGSGKAADLRDRVRGWVAEGRTEDQIRADMVAEFGESILGAPTFRGSNILVWVLPFVVLLLGALGIALFLKAQGQKPPPAEAAQAGATNGAPAVRSDLHRRVEEEVQARLN